MLVRRVLMRTLAMPVAAARFRLSPCGIAIAGLMVTGVLIGHPVSAQESPYFITYDHHMEEPRSVELSLNPVVGVPRAGNRSLASWLELEYGVTGWWTTELYLDGQTTFGDSSVFTGYRWENRVRLFMREHWINPVLYLEFEDINGADKILKEVVGFDSWRDQAVPNREAVQERKREAETKLILSRDVRGWNLAGNLIAEKNLTHAPWEFGYALGMSRPLVLAASPDECRLCRENFWIGLELYGGVGEWHNLTLADTSHYLAPSVSWSLPNGVTFRISPTFGLTADSDRALLRFGISYEIPALGRRVRRVLP
jgi:hypothetical protein